METIVHLKAGRLPLNRYLVALEIPDALWTEAQVLPPAEAAVGWDAEPAGRVSISFGSSWLRAARSALLVVPSAIIPEERNVLINPRHAAVSEIRATKVRKWLYDPRIRGSR